MIFVSAELTINGESLSVESAGGFNVKRYFPLGSSRLTFTATDIHGNAVSQTVTVIREAAQSAVAGTEPPLTPPQAGGRTNPHALALIIGVEDYRNAPQARKTATPACWKTPRSTVSGCLMKSPVPSL